MDRLIIIAVPVVLAAAAGIQIPDGTMKMTLIGIGACIGLCMLCMGYLIYED